MRREESFDSRCSSSSFGKRTHASALTYRSIPIRTDLESPLQLSLPSCASRVALPGFDCNPGAATETIPIHLISSTSGTLLASSPSVVKPATSAAPASHWPHSRDTRDNDPTPRVEHPALAPRAAQSKASGGSFNVMTRLIGVGSASVGALGTFRHAAEALAESVLRLSAQQVRNGRAWHAPRRPSKTWTLRERCMSRAPRNWDCQRYDICARKSRFHLPEPSLRNLLYKIIICITHEDLTLYAHACIRCLDGVRDTPHQTNNYWPHHEAIGPDGIKLKSMIYTEYRYR